MPEDVLRSVRDLRIMDVGRMPYDEALTLQERIVEERKRGDVPDTLILVEHDAVYTLGRNATRANVIATPEELEKRNIQIKETTRGGQVTYHGPGQIVGYPILRLREFGEGVLWYVEKLEQVLMRTLDHFGVSSTTDSSNRGVWVGNEKIAALGVRVTGRVTMHGFALNVRVNLDDYAGIIPCGIADRGVTSLHFIRPEVTIQNVKPILIDRFKEVFGYTEGKGLAAIG